ncbi:MAG: hypothetical protein PUK75_09925 [bacterium]|nr:hypothetical protein [bacterium]MDY4101097.1 hypothetical protein [Lachnospiraceae bacterium]
MKIIDRRKSLETCTESGWDAFDLLVDEPLTDDMIRRLSAIGGSFIYMSMLKKPFFKVESHYYVVKGLKGDEHFRVAVHKDYLSEIDRIVDLINR